MCDMFYGYGYDETSEDFLTGWEKFPGSSSVPIINLSRYLINLHKCVYICMICRYVCDDETIKEIGENYILVVGTYREVC